MYGRPLLFYHFQIAFGAVPDPGSRRSDSIAGEMSVTCCRLNLRVAQNFPIIGKPAPSAMAREAKEWRKSW